MYEFGFGETKFLIQVKIRALVTLASSMKKGAAGNPAAPLLSFQSRFELEVQSRSKHDPAIWQSLEAQQRIIIDAELFDLGLGQVHTLNADAQEIGYVVHDGAVQLPACRCDNWEAEG